MRRFPLRALISGSVAAALGAAPFLTAPAASASTAPGATTASVASAALASPAGKLPPWQTYRSGPLSYAAGQVCSFPLSGLPVRDGEQYRTLRYYPDGTAELNEYRGPLYVRFTNDATGRSVVRNLSGYGYFRFADGTGAIEHALFLNNGGVTVKVGNHGFPAGYYIEHGQILVTDNGQGTRVIHVINARLENLCRTLAS
jgi:hypothetical protein